ncbi:MAG TPA: helix-turn-helix transcriptional regulator [Solirubrobacteraceae bacterium]|jgi:transcriptional regulator with XRE-family HTH domain
MRSADLLVAGRRRAGLSQAQVAQRLGRPQATIARWETGRQRPPLESVLDALHVCGLELTVGIARYDDSYGAQIARQLCLTPAERVRRLAPAWAAGGFDPLGVLERLAGRARFVVLGDVAGALHGWPVMLGARRLEILLADTSLRSVERVAERLDAKPAQDGPAGQRRWLLADGGELWASTAAAGTRGYRDVVRDAETMQLAPSVTIGVASLIDLIRIAEASPDAGARVHVPALWATLDVHRQGETVREAV